MIYWFTGQPGAGKTVLALKLIEHLKLTSKKEIIHIDGDNLREITQNFDYTIDGRKKNIENVHTIARFMDYTDHDVVISVVAPLREMRNNLKKTNNMVEIYVHTTNIRGREKNFAKNYEVPNDNFIDIDTTIDTAEESLKKILLDIK